MTTIGACYADCNAIYPRKSIFSLRKSDGSARKNCYDDCDKKFGPLFSSRPSVLDTPATREETLAALARLKSRTAKMPARSRRGSKKASKSRSRRGSKKSSRRRTSKKTTKRRH